MHDRMHSETHSWSQDRPTLNVVRARAPRELLNEVRAAARREGIAASEFVRRALRDRIRADGITSSNNRAD